MATAAPMRPMTMSGFERGAERSGEGEEASRQKRCRAERRPRKAIVWAGDGSRDMKSKDEDEEHDSRAASRRAGLLIQSKAESSCEESESEKDDPEGWKGSQCGYRLGKGAFMLRMCSAPKVASAEAAKTRPRTIILSSPAAAANSCRAEMKPMMQEDDSGKPRPEDVVCKQSWPLSRGHTSADAGSPPESSDLSSGIA